MLRAIIYVRERWTSSKFGMKIPSAFLIAHSVDKEPRQRKKNVELNRKINGRGRCRLMDVDMRIDVATQMRTTKSMRLIHNRTDGVKSLASFVNVKLEVNDTNLNSRTVTLKIVSRLTREVHRTDQFPEDGRLLSPTLDGCSAETNEAVGCLLRMHTGIDSKLISTRTGRIAVHMKTQQKPTGADHLEVGANSHLKNDLLVTTIPEST
jgi:hypothetical protein